MGLSSRSQSVLVDLPSSTSSIVHYAARAPRHTSPPLCEGPGVLARGLPLHRLACRPNMYVCNEPALRATIPSPPEVLLVHCFRSPSTQEHRFGAVLVRENSPQRYP